VVSRGALLRGCQWSQHPLHPPYTVLDHLSIGGPLTSVSLWKVMGEGRAELESTARIVGFQPEPMLFQPKSVCDTLTAPARF
jgi:hypothetical protein